MLRPKVKGTFFPNKKQKLEVFQQTLPAYVESVKIRDRNNLRAIEMHKDVFEYIVEDMHPWSVKRDLT